MSYKLVIVDDEKEISNGFAKYFPWGQLGYMVIGQFQNGKEVLHFLKNHETDVIVTDVLMPGMNGLEMAKELSLLSPKKKPMLVFFSAYDEFKYAQQAMEYGASQYLLKSISFDDLIDVFTTIKDKLDEEKAEFIKMG